MSQLPDEPLAQADPFKTSDPVDLVPPDAFRKEKRGGRDPRWKEAGRGWGLTAV